MDGTIVDTPVVVCMPAGVLPEGCEVGWGDGEKVSWNCVSLFNDICSLLYLHASVDLPRGDGRSLSSTTTILQPILHISSAVCKYATPAPIITMLTPFWGSLLTPLMIEEAILSENEIPSIK